MGNIKNCPDHGRVEGGQLFLANSSHLTEVQVLFVLQQNTNLAHSTNLCCFPNGLVNVSLVLGGLREAGLGRDEVVNSRPQR